MVPSGTDTPVDSVVVCNPVSGSGDHVPAVRDAAADHGFRVRETDHAGHGVDLAKEAVTAGATFVAAAGGDGTLNEVIRGIADAGALDRVTVGVVPCGTGNNFARNIGITDIEGAFEMFDSGERRRVDIAVADGRPFINSCVGGLTAEASAETSAELKRRFGAAAYLL